MPIIMHIIPVCPSPVIIAHYAGGDQEAAGVWPGDGGELSPPPADHDTEGRKEWMNKYKARQVNFNINRIPDIESKNKCDRDQVRMFLNR